MRAETAPTPLGAHRCPRCGAACACAEFYDGEPCHHATSFGCATEPTPPLTGKAYRDAEEALNAEIGAALRKALDTVQPGHDLVIDCPTNSDVVRQVYVAQYPSTYRHNDATRALAALLHSPKGRE